MSEPTQVWILRCKNCGRRIYQVYGEWQHEDNGAGTCDKEMWDNYVYWDQRGNEPEAPTFASPIIFETMTEEKEDELIDRLVERTAEILEKGTDNRTDQG